MSRVKLRLAIKVAALVSLSLGVAFAEEPTLGENSAYLISTGSSDDFDFRTYSLDKNGNLTENFYKYTLPTSFGSPSGGYSYTTTGDYAYAYGGKYANRAGSIGDITSDYINNHLKKESALYTYYTYGGAVANLGTINDITGDFINNSVFSYINAKGGAIYNEGFIDNIVGNFINNCADTDGAGGAIYSNRSIGDIKGNFIGNRVESSAIAESSKYTIYGIESNIMGGAIYAGGKFGEINSNFYDNYVKGDFAKASGGAIASTAEIKSIKGDFINNYAESKFHDAAGGAIYKWNDNDLTINGSFINNYVKTDTVALGGAIFTEGNITLQADANDILISGNYTQDTRGKVNNAIWVKSSSLTASENPTATLNAVNSGTIKFNDQIDGGLDVTTKEGYQYNLAVTGDATSKVILNNSIINANATLTNTNLYMNPTAFADDNTTLNANSGTIHLANDTIENYEINKLVSSENVGYSLDVDLTEAILDIDTITTGSGSNGTVRLSDLNINGALKDFNLQVIYAEDDNIMLDLSEDLKNFYNKTTTNTVTASDTVAENVNWKDKFNYYEQVNTTTSGLSVTTTSTTNDSLAYSTTTEYGEKVVSNSMGDTLNLVNKLETPNNRSFNFDNSDDRYLLTQNLATTSIGKLSVNGVAENNTRSELNLNGYTGFSLSNSSTLDLNNTKLIGNNTLVNVSNQDATINLKNSVIDGNIISTQKYSLNIIGSNENKTTLNGSVGNANVSLKNSQLEFLGNTFENAELTAQSGIINLQNETVNNYTIAHLESTSDVKYQFDIDLSNNGSSDKLFLGNRSSGIVTVGSINFINDVEPNKEFTVQLLDTNSSAIQLALNSEISNVDYKLGTVSKTIYDVVTPTVRWTEKFSYYIQKGTNYGNVSLATTNTVNDSLALNVTNTVWDEKIYSELMGDTLSLVNKLETTDTRNFNFDNATDVYTVHSDLGTTSSGTININGVSTETGRSTINGNSKTLFKLDNETDLNLNNVKIQNAASVVTGSNKDTEIVLNNVELKDNSSGIRTAGSVTIKGDSTLTNNGNGIEVTSNTSEITVDATDSEITLGDTLTGVRGARLNLNNGRVKVQKKISALDVMMNNAEVDMASDTLFNGQNITVNTESSLNMINNATSIMSVNTLTLKDTLNLAVDVDLANQSMDRIIASNYDLGSYVVNVNQMNLLTSTDRYKTDIPFADAGLKNSVTTSISEIAYSPIYKYNVAYSKDSGEFSFTRAGVTPVNPTPDNPNGGGTTGGNSYDSYNPAVMASPVAAQLGGYMGMLDTYNNAFAHMDMYMLKPSTVRLAEQRQNQYAITESANVTYNGKPNEMNSKGAWVKPYASFDSVSLKDGPKADNFSYGSFIGGDSDMFKLKNGFYGVVSPYVAYQGSHQSYSGNSVYQNGGTVGVTGTFYKGNFFTGVTVGTGANISEASTMYGSEDFPMLMAGIANKTGYNFEFKDGRFIIQPNLQLSYTFVNTFDYTNGAGVRIESDPLHAIQVAPNVKFIMNTEGGWQPYATVGFRWNIMDETNFTAAESTLPEMSIKPYVNYGFGIQRTINDRLTAYGQIMLRHGGRNGIAANFGGRYMLGSESDPNANKHEL